MGLPMALFCRPPGWGSELLLIETQITELGLNGGMVVAVGLINE